MFRKNEENPTSYKKLYNFQRKHSKTGHYSQKICSAKHSLLGLLNRKYKYMKNLFGKQFHFFPSGM